MPLEYLISAAVTLFVVVDPIGLAPTFLSVTTGIPDAVRRDVALRAAVIAGGILLVFRLATRIGAALGTTGSMLLSRLQGVLLASLAVQFVIDGLRAVLGG